MAVALMNPHNNNNIFIMNPFTTPRNSTQVSSSTSPTLLTEQQQQQQQQQQPNYLRSGSRLSSSYGDLPLTQQQFIGSYRLGRTLGTGSFGKVKLGTNVWTGEQVAVKSVPQARKDYRLEREIENLKSLDHPNIIKLYETVETANKIHLVMEYVSGGELFDYIVQKRRLREDEARQFLREMISALDYSHGSLVAHRDLKLENILLSEDGHIKIADFGFSAVIRPGNRFNSFCGSPMYSAPELFLGQEYLGPPVDIWALGAILYAMVCGFLPFGKWKDDMRMLVRKVCEGEFEIPNFISRPCQRLILRMLRPSLEERISMDELRRDPWVNFDCPSPPRCFLPKRPIISSPSKVNMEVVNQLTSLGFGDRTTVIEKLLAVKSERSQITALYHLLLERQERDLQELERQQQQALQEQHQELKHLTPIKRRSSPPCPVPAASSVLFKLETISEVEEDLPLTSPTLSNFFSSRNHISFSSSSVSTPNSPLASPHISPSPSPPRSPRSRGDSWAPPRKGSANSSSGPPSPSFAFRLRGKQRQTAKDLPLSSSSGSPPHKEIRVGGSYLSTINRGTKISNAPTKLYSSCGSEMVTIPTPAFAVTSTSNSSTPASSTSGVSISQKRSRMFSFSFSMSSSSGGVKVLSEEEMKGLGLRSCKASMFNVDTSSSKSPEAIASLLRKTLDDNKQVRYKVRANGFEFKCKVPKKSSSTTTSRPSSATTSPSTSTTSMMGFLSPLDGTGMAGGLLGGGITSGSGTGSGSFVIQVCRIDKLNLYGVRCSRFTGDRWLMRDFCGDILTSINL